MEELDPEQVEAAAHGEGPALVLAGPGTGKTTALVARYARLVRDGAAPSSILAATFTRRAADELRARVGRAAGIRTGGLPIGTFHALCLRLLRELGDGGGIGRDERLIDEGEQFALLRELGLHRLGELADLRDAIARYKDRLVGPEEAVERAERDEEGDPETAKAYARYQEALRDRSLHDFGDLIARAVEALRADTSLRADCSQRFRWLLVDEYQDVNPAQHALLEALTDRHDNLWVVGDDDQAIYGWRGSDVGYIARFTERMPHARLVRLVRNHRSLPAVLRAADHLVAHNRRRLGKQLQPLKEGRAPLVLCRCADERDEASWIAGRIGTLLDKGMPRSEIAVLVRTAHLTVALEGALDAAGIPFTVRGGSSFWRLPEVRTLLAALRHATGHAETDEPIGLRHLRADIDQAVRAERGSSFGRLARAVADVVAARPPFSAPSERRLQWRGAARQVAREADRFDDAEAFYTHVAEASRRVTDRRDGEDAVTLSTIHQAKGLEWEAVFVTAMEDELLPHARAEDPEEERRLAFVAATRAKRYLCLTRASGRGDEPAEPSPFLDELTKGLAAAELDRRRTEAEQARAAREAKQPAPSGSRVPEPAEEPIRVRHRTYGRGHVVRRDGDTWTVQFATAGEKRIHRRYLRRIDR